MLRFTSIMLILWLGGCSESHSGFDAGPATAVDAAPERERPDPDRDADVDASAPRDGGDSHDGGPEPVRCMPTAARAGGEACFCRGPLARFGDTLYRRALGIEVWDVSDPAAPVRVGTVEERPRSSGDLVVVGDLLVSVGDFEPAMQVYSLADPRAPVAVGSGALPEGRPVAAAALDSAVAIVVDLVEEGARVARVDLGDPASPDAVYQRTLVGSPGFAGSPGGLATDGSRLFVLTGERHADEAGTLQARVWLHVLDAGSGALRLRHELDDDPETAALIFHALATHGDRLLHAAPGVPVRVLEVDDAVREVGRLAVEDSRTTALSSFGARLLAGGDLLRVVDLSNPRAPRLLGASEEGVGDLGRVEQDAEVAWVSTGGGLHTLELGCE